MSSRVQDQEFRPPRLVQRFRLRPRGGGPRPGPSLAGAGGDPRAAGGDKRTSNAPHPAPHGLQCLSFSSVRSGICRFPQMVAGATTALLLAVDDTFR
jgi:hypothetical protein